MANFLGHHFLLFDGIRAEKCMRNGPKSPEKDEEKRKDSRPVLCLMCIEYYIQKYSCRGLCKRMG